MHEVVVDLCDGIFDCGASDARVWVQVAGGGRCVAGHLTECARGRRDTVVSTCRRFAMYEHVATAVFL